MQGSPSSVPEESGIQRTTRDASRGMELGADLVFWSKGYYHAGDLLQLAKSII